MNSHKIFRFLSSTIRLQKFNQVMTFTLPAGPPGAGVGKGGGAGGSIRESGGGLGKFGAAQEEGYFYQKDKEKLSKIKREMPNEPPKQDKKPV